MLSSVLVGHGALLAGAAQPGQHLLAVEGLAASVLLHHHVRDLVDPLVGGEALGAAEALAPAADDLAFLALARVHHLVLEVAAVGTLHLASTGSGTASCGAGGRLVAHLRHLRHGEALAAEEDQAEKEDGDVREGVGRDAGGGRGRLVHAEGLGERHEVRLVEAAHHARGRHRHAHGEEAQQQERGVERQVQAEREVVPVQAQRDGQPTSTDWPRDGQQVRRARPGARRARRRTSRSSVHDRARPARAGNGRSSRSARASAGGARRCSASRTPSTASAPSAARAPPPLSTPRSGPCDLRARASAARRGRGRRGG